MREQGGRRVLSLGLAAFSLLMVIGLFGGHARHAAAASSHGIVSPAKAHTDPPPSPTDPPTPVPTDGPPPVEFSLPPVAPTDTPKPTATPPPTAVPTAGPSPTPVTLPDVTITPSALAEPTHVAPTPSASPMPLVPVARGDGVGTAVAGVLLVLFLLAGGSIALLVTLR